jgi:hypothetical protein
MIRSREMQQARRNKIITAKFFNTSEGNTLLSGFWNKWESNMKLRLKRVERNAISYSQIKFTEGVV